MRVVQLNCVFGTGSTGKIVEAIHRYLEGRGDEPYALYGYGPTSRDPRVIRVVPRAVRKLQSLRSRMTGYPYGGSVWGTRGTVAALSRLRPDVVHIHCYNAYIASIYGVLGYLKEAGVPVVLTNHAEFMYTGGCTHAIGCEKWLTGCGGCGSIGREHPKSYLFDRTHEEWGRLREAYDGFGRLTVCCVSDWVRARAERSPFFAGRRVVTVMNGLDTATFRYRPNASLRASLAEGGFRKVVVHATPGFGSPIKGGGHVLEMARRMPDVAFVVVGDSDGVTTGLPNVRLVGRVDSQVRLAEYYSVADACLLTSERETFSMVTAESLCCGTPVVGFEAGGPESIAIPGYGEFVPAGDDDALERSLTARLETGCDRGELSAMASERYAEERMCEQYRSVYAETVSG